MTLSLPWTSMVATVNITFHIDVIVFVGLLYVGLGMNCTIFLPIASVMVVTNFGETVG